MPALMRVSRFRGTFALFMVVALAGACGDQQGVLDPGVDIEPRLSIAPAAPWTGSGPGTVSVANTAGGASLADNLDPAGLNFIFNLSSSFAGFTNSTTNVIGYCGIGTFIQMS